MIWPVRADRTSRVVDQRKNESLFFGIKNLKVGRGEVVGARTAGYALGFPTTLFLSTRGCDKKN